MKTASELKKHALSGEPLPDDLSPALQALWLDIAGEWDDAHAASQQGNATDGAWVHAYLHRKEGDISNATYWYNQADQPVCTDTLDVEWDGIATALLHKQE